MEKKLGDIAEISSGGTPSRAKSEYWNGDIPWVSTTLIDFNTIDNTEEKITQEGLKNSSAKLYPKGTVLMAMYGQGKTRGKVAILGIPATTNQACASVKANNNILNSSFLFQNLSKRYNEIRDLSNQGGQENLSGTIIKSISITFPSLSEQVRIANFLSLIDERIQTQNQIIEELKLLKSTISRKLFSEELRFKEDGESNFSQWAIKRLGEITVIVSKKNKNNEKLPIYSINNMLGFVPQNEQFEGIDSEDRGYDIALYKIVNKDTFAYNPARINVGSIGYSGDLDNIIISSLYVCFKTIEFVNDTFLLEFFKTNLFNKEVLKHVEGGVRDYLFYENFSRIKFMLPSFEEQCKIANFLLSFNSKIEIETQELQQLENQKKYLLSKLFI